MGNCLVLQEKAGRVMAIKTDSEILEHKTLIKVDDQVILSKLSHATSDHEYLVVKNMHQDAHEVLQNHLHAIKTTATKTTMKKKVRFSEKVIEGGDQRSGAVRVKVVMSKKELQEMLSGGEVSINGVILKVKNQEITNKVVSNVRDGWFPSLESIPEIN